MAMTKMRALTFVLVLIFLSNVTPLNSILKIVSGDTIVPGMSESFYITKDLKYIYQGNLSDTLKNSCYIQYKALSPASGTNLYRLQPIEPWKFWRWKEYLFEEKWKQPYQNVSERELKQALYSFSKAYQSPDGTLSCSQPASSLKSRIDPWGENRLLLE
ncbi:hypothetical protein [Spirosoma linguale]|uniref:Uncharacterized protein n=1 Tax=Spirosoma linguale (strain ATCC 33905 / DSM 74 / LMG 10896 / Claus 1) TaxID=504472 RepID=D2QCS4_SPILD|nr:hypothetical protein Slin_2034 [Spirosoma linguale DSM 74]